MTHETWWGRTSLRAQTGVLWQIGTLDLLVERASSEFRVSWRHTARQRQTHRSESPFFKQKNLLSAVDLDDTRNAPPAPSPRSPFVVSTFQNRSFAIAPSQNEELTLTPVLPQLALAVYFDIPLNVQPNEKLTIGVMLPLEIKLEVSGSKAVCAVPLEPFSKTWFGPNALEGELALNLDRAIAVDTLAATQPRPDQARSAVVLRNPKAVPVSIDRFLIPCGRLSLFHSPQTGFWTDSIAIDALADEPDVFQTERTFPREAGPPQMLQLVATPRTQESIPINELAFRNIKNLFKERG